MQKKSLWPFFEKCIYNLLILSNLILIPGAVYALTHGLSVQAELYADTGALLVRARECPDIGGIIPYLRQYRVGLEKHGLTTGHWKLIGHGNLDLANPSPANSYAEHYQAVGQLIERCETLSDLNQRELAYQLGLMSVHDQISRLPNIAEAYAGTKFAAVRWMPFAAPLVLFASILASWVRYMMRPV